MVPHRWQVHSSECLFPCRRPALRLWCPLSVDGEADRPSPAEGETGTGSVVRGGASYGTWDLGLRLEAGASHSPVLSEPQFPSL